MYASHKEAVVQGIPGSYATVHSSMYMYVSDKERQRVKVSEYIGMGERKGSDHKNLIWK